MNISHRPILDTDHVVKLYTEKDGVDVKYVCTSALSSGTQSLDIFYRETPHPEFGNRYFALYWHTDYDEQRRLMITNADGIEDTEFVMLEIDGVLHYSQHRHDFHTVGDVSLDGGRAYFRCVGNVSYPQKTLVVKDGEFVEKTDG